MASFKRILIANRGEIAVRIIRTAQKMGLETIAVYSEADRGAPHVRMADYAGYLGESTVEQSYLNAEKILRWAQDFQAEAIHPGYGLLSEDPSFAESCKAQNLVFIGPTAEHLRDFGLKHRARTLAEQSGAPLPPGSGLIEDSSQALREAEETGFPVMLKSTAGGVASAWLSARRTTSSSKQSNGSGDSPNPTSGTPEFFWKNVSCGLGISKCKSLVMDKEPPGLWVCGTVRRKDETKR